MDRKKIIADVFDAILFRLYPASIKYHGNYEGGLLEHSFKVANKLVQLTKDNDLVWENEDAPFVIGILHDFCKIDDYVKWDCGDWKHNVNARPGHGQKSVDMIEEYFPNLLNEQEKMCIRYHMGAFISEEANDYGNAVAKEPNVLWTHVADMYVARVNNV